MYYSVLFASFFWLSSAVTCRSLLLFTVSFDKNDGTPTFYESVPRGQKVPRPTDPSKSGYYFAGWYKDNYTFQQPFNFDLETIASDITLYAKWEGGHPTGSSLQRIIQSGYIPSNLSAYDEVSRGSLAPYSSGTPVSAIYLTRSGAGTADGSSWANAYAASDIDVAMAKASDENRVYLLLMGEGTYDAGHVLSLKNNVAIIGGWPASGGWVRNPTEETVFTASGGNRQVFSNGAGISSVAMLYGVTITGGSAMQGGGMYNNNASPSLTKVKFLNNTANDKGGAMANTSSSSPILTKVTFEANRANTGGGGAVYNENSLPTFINVIFSNNSADGGNGGAVYYQGGGGLLTNVTFVGNSVFSNGGAMYAWGANLVLTNVTLSGNNAGMAGGGIYNEANTSAYVVTSTFATNTANTSGGGMYQDGGSLQVVGSIFWGNTSGDGSGQYYVGSGSSSTVCFSVVQDGTAVSGNTTDDPQLESIGNYGGYVPTIPIAEFSSAANLGLFVRRSAQADFMGNYSLYSSLDGNRWYAGLSATGSPVTPPWDAVVLTTMDARGNPRVGRPDAGAYER